MPIHTSNRYKHFINSGRIVYYSIYTKKHYYDFRGIWHNIIRHWTDNRHSEGISTEAKKQKDQIAGWLMNIDKRELRAVNNPIRKIILNGKFSIFNYLLRRNKLDLGGKEIIEAGCGTGYGLQIINKQYNPSKLYGFDILSKQVNHAKQMVPSAEIFQGDITNLQLSSETFDAVLISSVLHHVPQWQEGIGEIYRILKREGVLLINEINKIALDLLQRFLGIYHPKDSRFSWQEFQDQLKKTGFRIIDKKIILGLLGYFLCLKDSPTRKNM